MDESLTKLCAEVEKLLGKPLTDVQRDAIRGLCGQSGEMPSQSVMALAVAGAEAAADAITNAAHKRWPGQLETDPVNEILATACATMAYILLDAARQCMMNPELSELAARVLARQVLNKLHDVDVPVA